MENNTETKEPGFVLTSTKSTKVSFKDVDKKIINAIAAGKEVWITTKAQIAVKQETQPVPVNDGIEISISLHNPIKKVTKNKTAKKKK